MGLFAFNKGSSFIVAGGSKGDSIAHAKQMPGSGNSTSFTLRKFYSAFAL